MLFCKNRKESSIHLSENKRERDVEKNCSRNIGRIDEKLWPSRSKIYLSFFSHFFFFFHPQTSPAICSATPIRPPDHVIIFTRLHTLHGCNMYARTSTRRKRGGIDFQAEILQHPRKQIPLFFVRVKQTENCGTVYSEKEGEGERERRG